ncbi:MAG: DUF1330 domain-containing protein [Chloroflexi bacterium]|nr:DUF1330 domain-containing protein [Chloroflexota bacterium]
MPVHVIIDIKVLDEDMYGEYVKKVPPIVKKFGGRYLARGRRITTIFGSWHPERMILLEFDSMEQVNNWLNSREYALGSPLRENSTVTSAILIESGPGYRLLLCRLRALHCPAGRGRGGGRCACPQYHGHWHPDDRDICQPEDS